MKLQDQYDRFLSQGFYERATIDINEAKKILLMVREDYDFGKRLRSIEHPNWRIIFNIHYDVTRELCALILRFHVMKVSNHQGLFVALAVLEKMEYTFFETIRQMRNKNKYQCQDVPYKEWIRMKPDFDKYIGELICIASNKITFK